VISLRYKRQRGSRGNNNLDLVFIAVILVTVNNGITIKVHNADIQRKAQRSAHKVETAASSDDIWTVSKTLVHAHNNKHTSAITAKPIQAFPPNLLKSLIHEYVLALPPDYREDINQESLLEL
jgi:hypothetical protein